MKLISWNVCDTNPDAARIRNCLKKMQPDIVVLQEALPPHIEILKDCFSHVVLARDSIYGDIKSFLVIASNRELSNVKVVSHFPETKKKPSLLARFSKLDQFLDTISASVMDDTGQNIQIMNVHTSAYTGPSVRSEEIARCFNFIPIEDPCIIAGDFNSYAHPLVSWFFALPLGFRLKDLMIREAVNLRAGFAARGFEASVSGATYPKFGFELDQVFRRSVPVRSAMICTELWGSDHYPIVIEIA